MTAHGEYGGPPGGFPGGPPGGVPGGPPGGPPVGPQPGGSDRVPVDAFPHRASARRKPRPLLQRSTRQRGLVVRIPRAVCRRTDKGSFVL